MESHIMNSKTILVVSVSIAALVALVVNFSQTSNSEDTVASVLPKDNVQPVVTPAPKVTRNGQVLDTGIDQFNHHSPSANNTKIESQASENVRDTIVWQESEQSKAVLQKSGMIPADVREEAYVEVDLDELRTVEIGEYLDLYIPQLGGSYTGEVDYIQTHPNGDRTVEAHIPGAGTLYAAVITIGEEAIYANLATQEDVFIMEGIGKHAWIAPKSAMSQNHVEHETHEPNAHGSDKGKDPFSIN